jgi:hypothetical protein
VAMIGLCRIAVFMPFFGGGVCVFCACVCPCFV